MWNRFPYRGYRAYGNVRYDRLPFNESRKLVPASGFTDIRCGQESCHDLRRRPVGHPLYVRYDRQTKGHRAHAFEFSYQSSARHGVRLRCRSRNTNLLVHRSRLDDGPVANLWSAYQWSDDLSLRWSA